MKMHMLSQYKAVFFDVGGTLLRVEPSVGEVYAKYARSFGFRGSGEELDHQFRKQWSKSGGIESLGKKSGEAAEKKFWRNLVFQVFNSSGGLNDFEHYFETVYEAFTKKPRTKIPQAGPNNLITSGCFFIQNPVSLMIQLDP